MVEDSKLNNQKASMIDPSTPFVIEHKMTDLAPNGSFRPAAVLCITPALRTSGMLAELPGEELKTLLCLWTFLTPNGTCQGTEQQITQALRITKAKSRVRVRRLAELSWKGEPIVRLIERASGLDTYLPSPTLYTNRSEGSLEQPPQPFQAVPVASRDAVVSYSRARYARPRADVEREMAELNGWPLPEEVGTGGSDIEGAGGNTAPSNEEATKSVRRRLIGLGVAISEVERLLASYDLGHIKQQLDWLPFRYARNKPRFLVAAVDKDYAAPWRARNGSKR